MRMVFLCILIVAFGVSTVFSTSWISGDLDFDGDVDFADFIIFSQNFGKSGGTVGQPSFTVADTTHITIIDTLTVIADTDTAYVTVVVHEIKQPADGEIPNLAFITIYENWRNWDADAEDDGIEVGLFAQDISGNLIFSSDMPDNLSLTINIALYADDNNDDIPDEPAVYTGRFQGTSKDFFGSPISLARIPKEQIKVDKSTIRKYGILNVSLITPKQGIFNATEDYVLLYQ